MASASVHPSTAEPGGRPAGPFGRVLVGFDESDRFDDTLALARRLANPDAGRIAVGGRVDGRVRTAPPDADVVVVASAANGPAGRILVDRRLLRVLQHASAPICVAPAGLRETEPFHHIGVAVDDSAAAAAAVACAYALAARDGCAVTLLRALPRVTNDFAYERELLRERLTVQEQLDCVADLAPAGVNPRARLLHGDPGTVLAKAFDDFADLVVCGTHGHGPLQRALAGSVSRALLEAATQPVLVVPSPPPVH